MSPREYLSFTQKQLWEKDPKKYIERYLYDAAQFTTREMAFGKRLAVAVEEEKDDEDQLLNEMIAKLPKLDQAEVEVRADMKIGKEIVPLYGKLDHARKDLTAFREYKTGKTKWTQRKVDEDKQITFYCTMIFILTGKIPNDIMLAWVPTIDDPDAPGGISCTGEVHTFRTSRSISQVITEMASIKKVWAEIQAMCEEEML